MKKTYLTILLLLSVFALNAQVRGFVQDNTGKTVTGAYIYVTSDPKEHTISQKDGSFYINAEPGEYINIALSNILEQTFEVTGNDQVFVFSGDARTISNGFSAGNRITSTMAISSIHSKTLQNVSGANDIYQSLFGTLAGLTVMDDVGWDSNPSFMIRGGATITGRAPLILVDGYARAINTLSLEEIESVSVLKDGPATALYGSEGANGVIVITTKRGEYKKMEATVDYKFSMGVPNDMATFVDAADYAVAKNQALAGDGLPIQYSDKEIAAFADGRDPYNYPNVNWMEEGLRDFTTNHRLNLTFKGGGDNVRYFTNVNYYHDEGLLETGYVEKADRYSPQLRCNNLSARVNLDVDLSKSTFLQLNVHGDIRENHRPAGAAFDASVTNFARIPAGAFPIQTPSGEWGSSLLYETNPIAVTNRTGYFNRYSRLLFADMKLKQDFSGWVKGLSAELGVSWDNMAIYEEGNRKNFRYQVLNPSMDPDTGEITNSPVIYGENKDFSYSSGLSGQLMHAVLDVKASYKRNFGKHNVDANLLYRMQASIPSGQNSTRRTQNVMFYGGYNYDNRYMVDIVANGFGSSVLLKGHKYSFYPAISAAWLISNESWMKDSAVNFLKLRLSYGRSGLVTNGYDLDRSFYVGGGGYDFCDEPFRDGGVKIDKLPVASLRSQISDRFNVGVDFSLLSKWDFSVDFFKEHRSRILVETGSLYSDALGITPPQENKGIVDALGTELSTMYHDQAGDLKWHIGGTFSFARSRVIENAIPDALLAEPYLSRKGHRSGQIFCLQVDPEHPFFNSQEEIDNSPFQTFSTVRPGDLKYVDQNGDNKIDGNDVRATAFSTAVPELYYGINLGLEWKGLGFNLNFQGTGNYNAFLGVNGLHRPMADGANLSNWYWKENIAWTSETADQATLPRLSTKVSENNNQQSTFWLRDASYFSLRNAYIFYHLPQKWCHKMHMADFQIFLKGDNLFMIDDLKHLNPDDPGTLYPDLRVFNIGLTLKF